MTGPRALGLEDGRIYFTHRCDRPFKTFWKPLSRQLIEERFAVEEVEVARTAFHEEKDDIFGLGETVRNFGRGGIELRGRRHELLSTQCSVGERTKSRSGDTEELAPVLGEDDVSAGH